MTRRLLGMCLRSVCLGLCESPVCDRWPAVAGARVLPLITIHQMQGCFKPVSSEVLQQHISEHERGACSSNRS